MYEVKGKTTEISATSRASIKCLVNGRECFYTVEHMEKRTIPDVEGVDLEEERKALWNVVNEVVDYQCKEIIELTKNK